MARKNTVQVRSPDHSCTALSVEGIEYEGRKGFFDVPPAHAAVLEAAPFFFSRVAVDAEDAAEDEKEGDAQDFKAMSKAELIDFIMARGEAADRKQSKEQLIALAESVKDKPAQEE